MKAVVLNPLSWLRVVAVFAVLFGALTLISGGSVLFNAEARQAAGNVVPFVVWYNFLAGFVYIVAGIGLWFLRRWSIWLSFLIAGATLAIFAAFGGHILSSGAYELRTVAAMGLRSAVWLVIAAIAYRHLNPKPVLSKDDVSKILP